MAEVTFKVAVITSSVVKITFVVAEITFKVAVITFSVIKISLFSRQDHFCSYRDYFLEADIRMFVAKINFVEAEITFNVTVITSSVAKATFVLAKIQFNNTPSRCDHIFSFQDHFCSS